MKEYIEFLKSKIKISENYGFEISIDEINPKLKPHNKLMVKWLVEGGKRACFASFGLHKTVTQLEAVRCTLDKIGYGSGLIVCPLSVRQEFVEDARNILGWEVSPTFIRRENEISGDGIYLTNYESIRDGKLNPNLFQVASLDEASVLRGLGGSKTFREFMRLFTGDAGPMQVRRGVENIKYRFVATATPSPNDYIELLAYADIPVVKQKKEWLSNEKEWKNADGYSRARWQLDAAGYTRSSGNRGISPDEISALDAKGIFQAFKKYSLNEIWDFEYVVKIAETLELKGKLPSGFMLLQPQSWSDDVWADITRMRTLNGSQWSKGKEMHLCPMQFDIADRVIEQMSNPGDTVLDPFGGLMTVPYRSLVKGRKGIAVELNPSYFIDGASYCKSAEMNVEVPSLFDLCLKTS